MFYSKIVNLFSHENGFHFARWSKAISPIVFGVDDDTLKSIRATFSDVLSLTSVSLSDLDPEFGANFIIFFCSEWSELESVPNLYKMIPNLRKLVIKLEKGNANQYRSFSFTSSGSIKLCILIIRYDHFQASVSVQTLSMSQILKSLLLWSPQAFAYESPIIKASDSCPSEFKPFYAALLKASYDPILPDSSVDEAHALRLNARVCNYLGEV